MLDDLTQTSTTWWRRMSIAGVVCLATPAFAQNPASEFDLTELSIEDRGALNISAASKRKQAVFETPAAVTVIRGEDIRRSGLSATAEAFRLAPGTLAANANNSRWEVSVRGFGGQTWTKLLVLVDGRNIYSPFYGGVDWAEANIPIDDVAQIEIVRGPGGTIWGANAMNGIVNIVSKTAHQTHGGLLAVREGSAAPLDVYARYGGGLGSEGSFRVYAQHIDSERSLGRDLQETETGIVQSRAGWRSDAALSERLSFTTQADIVSIQRLPGALGNPEEPPGALGQRPFLRNVGWIGRTTRYDILSRLNWSESPDHDLVAQVYFDAVDGSIGDEPTLAALPAVVENGASFDLDLTYHRRLGDRHDIVTGGGFRRAWIRVDAMGHLALDRPDTHQDLWNIFIQDEIALVPERWFATVGSKFEHHDSIGWQVLPGLRFSYSPNQTQTWWASASRVIRAPARGERDGRLPFATIPPAPGVPPMRIDISTNPELREERLTAYEAGWRYRPTRALSLDTAVYYNSYTDLRQTVPVTSPEPGQPLIVTELRPENALDLNTWGAEARVTWRLSDDIELSAHGSIEDATEAAPPPPGFQPEVVIPRGMWGANAWFALPHDLEVSVGLYHVGAIRELALDAYTRTDFQVCWRPRLDLELSAGVQNAFDAAHLEAAPGFGAPTAAVRRNFFGGIKWKF